MIRLLGSSSILATLVLGTAADAREAAPQPAPWPVTLRTVLERLNAVEWRLRDAAGHLCPKQASTIGVAFDDRTAYAQSDWPLLESSLGLGDAPQLAAVAPGSPADAAGLRAGDEVLAIGGEAVEAIGRTPAGASQLVDRLADKVAALTPGRSVDFTVRRDGADREVAVIPLERCAARFVVKTDNAIDAYSDKNNLALTARLILFTLNDDELALIAGHELGHILARDGKARGVGERRAMEARADALGARLAACAGYDVAKSLAFWPRLEKRDLFGWVGDPTHGSAKKRITAMAALPLSTPPSTECPLDSVPPLQP